MEVVLQRLGDDHGPGRPPGRLRERPPGFAQMQQDGPDHGDVEGPEVSRHVVDVPLDERGGRPQGAVQVPPGVVVAVDGLLHDEPPILGIVLAPHGERVDGDVEPGLEGDHLGAHALHGEGQVAGGRSELEHPLAGEVHAAEVVGLVAAQVPDTGQDRPVGQFEGVVPDEVGEVGARAPLRQRGLKAGVELAEVVARRVAGQEGAAGGRGAAAGGSVEPVSPVSVSRRRNMGRTLGEVPEGSLDSVGARPGPEIRNRPSRPWDG